MTNTIKSIGGGILGGLVVLLLSGLSIGGASLGGVHNNVTKDYAEGISVDGTVVIDGSGNVDAPITSNSLTIGGGTAIDKIVCSAATTWNPAAVVSTSTDSLEVSVSGLSLGDVVIASIATGTQGLGLLAAASTTDLARVTLFNPDSDASAINLATTTVRVCAISN